jgi:hypothetical protein
LEAFSGLVLSYSWSCREPTDCSCSDWSSELTHIISCSTDSTCQPEKEGVNAPWHVTSGLRVLLVIIHSNCNHQPEIPSQNTKLKTKSHQYLLDSKIVGHHIWFLKNGRKRLRVQCKTWLCNKQTMTCHIWMKENNSRNRTWEFGARLTCVISTPWHVTSGWGGQCKIIDEATSASEALGSYIWIMITNVRSFSRNSITEHQTKDKISSISVGEQDFPSSRPQEVRWQHLTYPLSKDWASTFWCNMRSFRRNL